MPEKFFFTALGGAGAPTTPLATPMAYGIIGITNHRPTQAQVVHLNSLMTQVFLNLSP